MSIATYKSYHRPASRIATLQSRNFTEPLEQMMQQACGGDPRKHRRQVLVDLQVFAIKAGNLVFLSGHEELIHHDRHR